MTVREPGSGPQLPHDVVAFWGGSSSNFAFAPMRLACPFTGVLRTYDTVEHYFQACKATTRDDHVHVAQQPSPREAKDAGRAVTLRLTGKSTSSR